jgi:hypothetical protein
VDGRVVSSGVVLGDLRVAIIYKRYSTAVSIVHLFTLTANHALLSSIAGRAAEYLCYVVEVV